jgi:chromosome segregation ATPase
MPGTISFYIMESITIPRARDSASHEIAVSESNEITHTTIRHSSTLSTSDDECVKLRQQLETLQQQIGGCQEIIASLENENGVYAQDNVSLSEVIKSLETQLAGCRDESEKYKNDSERHRHELWVFCRLFSNRKSAIEAEHQEALKQLKDKIITLETDSSHIIRQYHRHVRCNDQLCRHIESLNVYIGEIEAESSHLALQLEACTVSLQIKSTELGLLQAQHSDALQSNQANIYTLEADSRHSLRQYHRHIKYSDQLCRHIESLNIYVGEIEAELTYVACQFEACTVSLQCKSTELDLLQAQHMDELQSHQTKVDALQGELQISKHGIRRAVAFLAELASRASV